MRGLTFLQAWWAALVIVLLALSVGSILWSLNAPSSLAVYGGPTIGNCRNCDDTQVYNFEECKHLYINRPCDKEKCAIITIRGIDCTPCINPDDPPCEFYEDDNDWSKWVSNRIMPCSWTQAYQTYGGIPQPSPIYDCAQIWSQEPDGTYNHGANTPCYSDHGCNGEMEPYGDFPQVTKRYRCGVQG